LIEEDSLSREEDILHMPLKSSGTNKWREKCWCNKLFNISEGVSCKKAKNCPVLAELRNIGNTCIKLDASKRNSSNIIGILRKGGVEL
jgi:hypothetical protein